MVRMTCYPCHNSGVRTRGRKLRKKEAYGVTDIRRERRFYIVTVLLILIIGLCVRGTVFSRENDEREQRNLCYAALEEEYLEEARSLLRGEGLADCGVDLRWVSYGDGSREYTVSLHHSRLEYMSEADKETLKRKLSEADFHGDACSFSYVL